MKIIPLLSALVVLAACATAPDRSPAVKLDQASGLEQVSLLSKGLE